MAFPSIRMHRARRLIACGSPVLFAGGVALAGLVLSKDLSLDRPVVWVLLVLWIALLLFQMSAEYKKRTYDPTWLLKFVDEFHSEEMLYTRSKAATFLKENEERLGTDGCNSSDVDDVLDCFENIGFFLQGDQLTAEAAHHAFHHWIRGYYNAAESYLNKARNAEPSTWEFVELLFDMTDQIERERDRSRSRLLDKEGKRRFLDEEIELYSDPAPIPETPANEITRPESAPPSLSDVHAAGAATG